MPVCHFFKYAKIILFLKLRINSDSIFSLKTLSKFNLYDRYSDALTRLDKFWSNQEVLYNYKADLHGTGNRSILDQ